MSFLGKLFGKRDREMPVQSKAKFSDYILGDITAVSITTNAKGTYELYRCGSRTTALAFLRSIPQNTIPALYYVIVETSEGNFGKDLQGIFNESTGAPISQVERLLKVNLGEEKPEFLEKMIGAGQSVSFADTRGISEVVSVEDMQYALEAKHIMQQADEYARTGDFEKAKDAYSRFINTANFEDDVAFYSLAGVSQMLGYQKEARRYAQEALRVNPANAKAALLLGDLRRADRSE